MDLILKENLELEIIYNDNTFYIEANKFGKYLDINNIRTLIANYDYTEKKKIITNTNGGNQNMIYLSKNGIIRLLCSSRKPKSVYLASICGITNKYKFVPVETSFIINIEKAFKGEIIINQYKVDKYSIDIYFPKYKLAIEIDEYSHKFQKENDNNRQKYIENKLKCKFIRIKEKDDIFESINKIFKEINGK